MEIYLSPASDMKTTKHSTLYVAVPTELSERLRQFCELANREQPAVVRSALEFFLADGFQEAERRLSAKLWAAPGAPGPPPADKPSKPAKRPPP